MTVGVQDLAGAQYTTDNISKHNVTGFSISSLQLIVTACYKHHQAVPRPTTPLPSSGQERPVLCTYNISFKWDIYLSRRVYTHFTCALPSGHNIGIYILYKFNLQPESVFFQQQFSVDLHSGSTQPEHSSKKDPFQRTTGISSQKILDFEGLFN